MSNFYVKANDLGTAAKSFRRAANEVNDATNDLKKLRNDVDKGTAAYRHLSLIMVSCNALDRIVDSLRDCGGKLDAIAEIYGCTEERVCSNMRSPDKSFWEQAGNTLVAAWDASVGKASRIVKDNLETWSDLWNDEDSWLYQARMIGGGLFKVGKGAFKMGTAVVSILGTGGGSLPIALLGVVRGYYEIKDGLFDTVYAHEGMYEEMGRDSMREDLENGFGDIAEYLGYDRAYGEKLGHGFDNMADVTDFTLDVKDTFNVASKIKQANPTNLAALSKEFSRYSDGIVTIGGSNITAVGYTTKLFSYEVPETISLITNAKSLWDLGSGIKDIIKDAITLPKQALYNN